MGADLNGRGEALDGSRETVLVEPEHTQTVHVEHVARQAPCQAGGAEREKAGQRQLDVEKLQKKKCRAETFGR